MRSRAFRRSSLFGLVAAIALVTTGCWRVGNLDGPGTGSLGGRTGDAVNVDKSVAVAQISTFAIPVIAYADPSSNRLRWGIDNPIHGWQFSDLDGPGVAGGAGRTSDNVGTFNSTSMGAAVGAGSRQADVYYFDSTQHLLRHAHSDGGNWTFESLDGPGVGGSAGQTSDLAGGSNASAFFNNQTHDLYRAEHTSQGKVGNQTRLRHTWFDGQSWHFENVDGPGSTFAGHTDDNVGLHTAVQVYNGAMHAFYYDSTAHSLRHATYDGSTWTFEDLDGATAGASGGRVADDVGQYNATTTTPDGHLHVFYLDATTNRLRHAEFDGTSWTFSDLDGPGVGGGNGRTGDTVGGYAATAANAPGNVIDVFYSDDVAHSLRHARFDGVTWTFETIDGTGASTLGSTHDQVGQFNAAGYGGLPVELHMWTGDLTSGNLRTGCTLGPLTTPPATCS